MKEFTLPKTERLYLRDAIRHLFAEGKSFVAFPYRVIYRLIPESDSQEARAAIMTVVPKKRFRHAVDRNRVKRLTRECYRLNKLPLLGILQQHGQKLQVAFLYSDNKFLTFAETERKMVHMLKTLSEKAAMGGRLDPANPKA